MSRFGERKGRKVNYIIISKIKQYKINWFLKSKELFPKVFIKYSYLFKGASNISVFNKVG